MFASTPESSGYIDRLRTRLAGESDLYIVGGAVRDMLLGKPIHDVDFVYSSDVRPVARRLADHLRGGFYMLDDARNTARVIDPRDGNPVSIDFATFRAGDLDGDLRARDFTINAIAYPMSDSTQLIDPLNGAADLRAGILRACSPTSFEDDPLRVLRGVRLAISLGFRIEPNTFQAMRASVPGLARVSAERKRDELFRMFGGQQPGAAMRILERMGVFDVMMPELLAMKGVEQSAPHTLPVWEHTLSVLDALGSLLDVLVGEYPPEGAPNVWLGLAVIRLGRYRRQFAEHFARVLNPTRSLRSLLFFTALYHDAGKPPTQGRDETGRIHFYGHETLSARLAVIRGRDLALSRTEIDYVDAIIANHMRVHLLTASDQKLSRRSVYRFFRSSGDAGVDVCLLSLADVLATYGSTLDQDHWLEELDTCRVLLELYWEQPEETVRPPRLISGSDLMEMFRLAPGPVLGRALDAVQEAQAMGQVSGREQALDFVRGWLENQGQDESAE